MRRVSRVKHLRCKLGLSQAEFAERFRIPLGTLRDWNQHRTEPDQAALSYLKVIEADASEGPRDELGPRGIGVSVLCPGFIRINIANSQRNLPERFVSAAKAPPLDDARRDRMKQIADRVSVARIYRRAFRSRILSKPRLISEKRASIIGSNSQSVKM